MRMKWWLLITLAMAPLAALGEEVAGASPRNFYFEAKVSYYMPFIDAGYASPGPFASAFKSDFMWLGEAELEYQVFQKFGSLAVGLSVGYAEKYGKAVFERTGNTSSEVTGLHLIPVKVLAVYRFDWLNLKHSIPLIPYVKVGPAFIPWWVTKGPDLEIVDGKKGVGVKPGLAAVLGLAINLDFLDRRLARDFDSSVGINHSYLFAEWTIQDTLLFDQVFNPSNSKPLNLSSRHFDFGLGLEF